MTLIYIIIIKTDKNEVDMRNIAVVTGASSGLGEEFSRQLSKEGYHVIMVARRKDRLLAIQSELAGTSSIYTADLSKKKEINKLCESIEDELGKNPGNKLSVFINNAGFGLSGRFEDCDEKREIEMVDVNIKALHRLTKRMLPLMDKENGGYILNIGSSAGLFPAGPYMATYYATKAYVVSLTRAIAHELKKSASKTYIGVLCPGPVDTQFNAVANVVFALKGMSASSCVSYALKMMKKRKVVIVPTLRMKLACSLSRLLPGSLVIPMVAHQQHKKMG